MAGWSTTLADPKSAVRDRQPDQALSSRAALTSLGQRTPNFFSRINYHSPN